MAAYKLSSVRNFPWAPSHTSEAPSGPNQNAIGMTNKREKNTQKTNELHLRQAPLLMMSSDMHLRFKMLFMKSSSTSDDDVITPAPVLQTSAGEEISGRLPCRMMSLSMSFCVGLAARWQAPSGI